MNTVDFMDKESFQPQHTGPYGISKLGNFKSLIRNPRYQILGASTI
jgi:hypothetical protein